MIVIDGFPLVNAHKVRGIGYYVRGMIESIQLAKATHAPGLDIRLLSLSPDMSIELPQLKAWRPPRPHVRLGWAISSALCHNDFRKLRSASLFHATDPNGLCRPSRVPMLATAYDLIPLRFPSDYKDKFSLDEKLGYQAMLRRYRRAEGVVAISESTRTDFIELAGVDPTRIRVVYPGIDLARLRKRFAPRVDINEDEVNSQLPKAFFLYVGALDARKNIAASLEAYASVRSNLREDFVIAGNSSSAEMNPLKRLASKLDIGSRVHWLGNVENFVLGQLYARATALVFMSRHEGFGLPVLEAMAMNCPVISSDAGALSEIASGSSRIVHLDQPTLLAEAMIELSTDRNGIRAVLREAGKKQASRFELLHAGIQMLNTYKHFMQR